MSETRKPPPPLEPQFPLCSVCGNETQLIDDWFECEDCQARWPVECIGLATGGWFEPDAAQCESIDGRYVPGGCWAREHPSPEIWRCVLQAGHTSREHEFASIGTHRSWGDNDAATPAQLSQNAIEVSA